VPGGALDSGRDLLGRKGKTTSNYAHGDGSQSQHLPLSDDNIVPVFSDWETMDRREFAQVVALRGSKRSLVTRKQILLDVSANAASFHCNLKSSTL
jgi:hypothetical protein